MSNPSAITPDVLSLLREEDHYVKTTQRGERRVKLEKGQTWKIRFIPAQLGLRKTWFARIAKHWVNYKPVVCPVHTHPDFGGDPEAYCPACEMSALLNDSADEIVSKFGYRARAGSQWLTYCIVLDMDGNEVDGNELLNPYEMWHYQSTWDELKGFFKGRYTKVNPLSVLDYHKGNIFAVTRTAKGTRLDKLDECPIFADDPNFDSYIQRLEASIKLPKVVIPTQEQLEAFAAKMEDAAYKADSGDSRGRRAPAISDDPLTENDQEQAPAAPAAPARRPAPAAARPATSAPAQARPATPARRRLSTGAMACARLGSDSESYHCQNGPSATGSSIEAVRERRKPSLVSNSGSMTRLLSGRRPSVSRAACRTSWVRGPQASG